MPQDAVSSAGQRICICVCTRNRASQLLKALTSLSQLTPPADASVELLIVDNASTDETAATCHSFIAGHRELQCRYVLEPQIGFAFVRNRAVSETSANWIAFFDDDQVADHRWLAELWARANRDELDAVGGAVILSFVDGAFRPGPRCRSLLGDNQGECSVDAPWHLGTGNLLIRRSRLEEVGGFDITKPGRGEDTRLFAKLDRLGCQLGFVPQAKVEHVIGAARNTPSAYRSLAKECADGADLSHERWGRWLSLVALSRLCRICVIGVPRLAWEMIFGSRASRLDAQCAIIMEYWRGIHELRHAVQPRS